MEQVMKGVKLVQSKGMKKKARLPITPELLRKMKQSWGGGRGSRDNVMLWAAVSLCFFGFLRSGEITVATDNAYDEGTHLSFEDIAVDRVNNPQSLRVRIKGSKTDPF